MMTVSLAESRPLGQHVGMLNRYIESFVVSISASEIPYNSYLKKRCRFRFVVILKKKFSKKVSLVYQWMMDENLNIFGTWMDRILEFLYDIQWYDREFFNFCKIIFSFMWVYINYIVYQYLNFPYLLILPCFPSKALNEKYSSLFYVILWAH